MHSEYLFHGGELLTFIIVAWYVIKAANRVMDVLKDFPPHRHINGSIVYPDGYEPTVVHRLSRE